MKKYFVILLLAVLSTPYFVQAQNASTRQDDSTKLMQRIRTLESQVYRLESNVGGLKSEMRNIREETGGAAIVLFFFAVFCALWAQNTDRNPWQWFFLGLFFHIITAFFLLSKNAADKRMKNEP